MVIKAQRRHQQLEAAVDVSRWSWDILQDRLKERSHALRLVFQVSQSIPSLGSSIQDGEVELLGVCGQLQEEIFHHIGHLHRAAKGTVDLVDNYDGS